MKSLHQIALLTLVTVGNALPLLQSSELATGSPILRREETEWLLDLHRREGGSTTTLKCSAPAEPLPVKPEAASVVVPEHGKFQFNWRALHSRIGRCSGLS